MNNIGNQLAINDIHNNHKVETYSTKRKLIEDDSMKKRACLKKAESSISVSSKNSKQAEPDNQTITNITSQVSSINTFIQSEANNQTVNNFTSHINSKDYVDSEANKQPTDNATSEVSSKKTSIKSTTWTHILFQLYGNLCFV